MFNLRRVLSINSHWTVESLPSGRASTMCIWWSTCCWSWNWPIELMMGSWMASPDGVR